jgi:hypothetical protein
VLRDERSLEQKTNRGIAMTRSRVRLLLPAFVVGVVVGLAVPAHGGNAGSKVTNLLTARLSEEFTPGREVLVDLVFRVHTNGEPWRYVDEAQDHKSKE